jgi:hypothetical protein
MPILKTITAVLALFLTFTISAAVHPLAGRVSRLDLAPAGTQPAVSAQEYVVAAEIVRAYEPCGVEPDDVYIDVWAPGDLDVPGFSGRMLRALSFLRGGSVDDSRRSCPRRSRGGGDRCDRKR